MPARGSDGTGGVNHGPFSKNESERAGGIRTAVR
jgi:hypothetical protein